MNRMTLFPKYLLITLLTLVVISCAQQASQQEGEQGALTEAEQAEYIKKGKEIAMASFKALSGELQQALADSGVAHALKYCNMAALPITDSLAEVHQASIRRTALRYRNPANAPGQDERRMLEQYQVQKAGGQQLKPVVETKGDKVVFYGPIMLKPLCLNCHGTPGKEIAEADHQLIKELYPQDQAINFAINDLRGMWSIEMAR
jgi:hypothetical protein